MYKEYFKEIFQSNKTIIIPGLGAFTKAGDSDSRITFNPYLKFNDGFLAGFIAKKQGISMDEAGKLIADNVDKIQSALEQKGEAMVMGLGVLKKNVGGKIDFSTDVAGTDTPVSDVPKNIPVEKPVVEKVVPAPDVLKEKAHDVLKEKVVEPEKKVVVPEAKEKTEVNVNAPKLTEVSDKHLDKKAKEEEAKKEKLAREEEAKKAKLAKEEEAKKAKLEKEAEAKRIKLEKEAEAKKAKDAAKLAREQARGEKKKRRFPVWAIVLVVLLAGGGTFAALKWDMVKGWIGMGDKKEIAKNEKEEKSETGNEKAETAAGPVVDTTAQDTVIPVEDATAVEPVKEEVVEPVKETTPVKETPVVNTPTGTFHVITGNFQSQSLADGMVAKLNAEGHQAINLGMRGGFYMVSAGSFSTMEEANSKRQAISATHPKAYIYNGL